MSHFLAIWGPIQGRTALSKAAEQLLGAAVDGAQSFYGGREHFQSNENGWSLKFGLAAFTDTRTAPSATLDWSPTRLKVELDQLGFAHIYAAQVRETYLVSSSSTLIASITKAKIDPTRFAPYAMLGHLLGDQSPYTEIDLLPAASLVTFDKTGRHSVIRTRGHEIADTNSDAVVAEGIERLRSSMAEIVEVTASRSLALSGGLDSRAVFAALDPAAIASTTALSIESSKNSNDAAVAKTLAELRGMEHLVVNMDSLNDTSPEMAWTMVNNWARNADYSLHPITVSALESVERSFPQGVRLAGHGGEYARGTYQPRQPDASGFDPKLVRKLAEMRLFANTIVEPQYLPTEVWKLMKDSTFKQMNRDFTSYGEQRWRLMVEEFMQRTYRRRQFGAMLSGVAQTRPTFCPFLHESYLEWVQTMPTELRANNEIFCKLIVAMAPDFGQVPLVGNIGTPEEIIAARRTLKLRKKIDTSIRLTRKILQLAARRRRGKQIAPSAAALAEPFRVSINQHPEFIDSLADSGLVNIDVAVAGLRGDRALDANTLGYFVNVAGLQSLSAGQPFGQ